MKISYEKIYIKCNQCKKKMRRNGYRIKNKIVCENCFIKHECGDVKRSRE